MGPKWPLTVPISSPYTMCHNNASNLPEEPAVVVTSLASWPPPNRMWNFGSFSALYKGEIAASFNGRSVSYTFTHSYSSSMVHSLAVWSFELVIMSMRSSVKFKLVTGPLCAFNSFNCVPLEESQTITVPSSKIDTRDSSKGPHFTFVAFMGNCSSMDNNLFGGSNCQIMMRLGVGGLLNLSLQVTTMFWAPGFWFHSTNLRIPPWSIAFTCSPSKV
mmetsp:Transcript_53611/g.162839  ORF Transcript_53611/g.162839 Transcript_53611/m.162839 type:complete len:217 (+) Transcript_53611:336-986(+)